MKAAMLQANRVTNIIVVDRENFTRLQNRGYTLLAADALGLEIGDYTEDGTLFYRDVPVFDRQSGVLTGWERRALPIEEVSA